MKTTLAYLAGAIDADGYFGIKRWMVKCKTGSFPRFVCRVGLAEVTPEIPRLLSKTLGGSLRVDRRSHRHDGWQDMWVWSVDSRIAAYSAKKLIPFLRLKKRQAKLLLALQREIDKGPMKASVRAGRQGRQLSLKSIRKREGIWNAMKRLNR